jgi:hypothetical protein
VPRLLIAGLVAAGLAAAASSARAQSAAVEEAAADQVEPAAVSTQILGANLGLELGGGTSPGGLRVGLSYLYRLNDTDWLDSGAGFTFGSGDAACFRDRDDERVCDHGFASGFAAEAIVSIRRELSEREGFRPYVRAGLAFRLVSFGGDDVIGFSVPLLGSLGLHRRLHERVSLVAAVDLRTGWGVFNRDLGLEAQGSASFAVGAEVDLD